MFLLMVILDCLICNIVPNSIVHSELLISGLANKNILCVPVSNLRETKTKNKLLL